MNLLRYREMERSLIVIFLTVLAAEMLSAVHWERPV
jgi:hypothetical protein